MTSEINWSTGIPDKSGTYLVTTIFDVVDICHFKDGEWQIYDNEEIVAWCLMDNIKPYKEENYCQVIGNDTSSNGVDTSASSINEETMETLNNKTNKAIFETNAQACDIMNDIIKKDMEKKINIAELLKDCPKGMELDCTMFDDVKFIEIEDDDKPICIRTGDIYRYLTKFGTWTFDENAKCVIFPKGETTWEGFQISFKDGDIVATTSGSWIGITKGGKIDSFIPTYCVIKSNDEFEAYLDRKEKWQFSRLATEKEKEKLFNAIKANGYHWNKETKTLEKVLNKFDITTLIPFESRMLVRDSDYGMWKPAFWGKYLGGSTYSYLTSGGCYKQCIPYEGNEHLIGTTDNCDNFYKTW